MTEPTSNAPERAANILLDVVSVFDWSRAEDESNAEAMALALARLNAPELIRVTTEDDASERRITVDFMPVLTGAVLLLHTLIDGVVEMSTTGVTAHDVIVRLRERLDLTGEVEQ